MILVGYELGGNEVFVVADRIWMCDNAVMELESPTWVWPVDEVDDKGNICGWHFQMGNNPAPEGKPMYMPISRLIRWHEIGSEKVWVNKGE